MRALFLLLLAGVAFAGESTMPGERAALKSTCGNSPPFFCVGGKPGGQTLTCGTQSGDGCTFSSTSHATKGKFTFGQFTVNESTNRIGRRLTSPTVDIDFVGDDNVTETWQLTTYGANSAGTGTGVRFYGQYARGTQASPVAVNTSGAFGPDGLFSISGNGYDGTTFGQSPVQIAFVADGSGAWTTSSHPTQICEYTTASGATAPVKQRCTRNDGTQEFTKTIAKYNNIATADTSATSMPVLNGPAPITASSTAISNTVTETVFSNGSYNIAANTLTVGRTFRVQAWGQMGSTTTGPQVNLRLRWGANGAPVNTDPLLIDLQGTEGISVTTKGWFATFVATCRTVGASGTVDGNGMGVIPNSVALNDNQVATTTVDTTAAKTLALFVKFGAAAVADTITLEGFTVEWLN